MSFNYEISLDEQRQLILQKLRGTVTAPDARLLREESIKCSAKLHDPTKTRVLVDGRFMGKPADAEARNILLTTMKEDRLFKMAIWGATPVARTMLRFLSIMTGMTKARTFKCEEDAVEWLFQK